MGCPLRHCAVKNRRPDGEILPFGSLVQTGRCTIGDLGGQFGVSRKTACKPLDRYAGGGLAALVPRSHRPHLYPQRTDRPIVQLILGERRLHHAWGAEEAPGKPSTSGLDPCKLSGGSRSQHSQ